MWSCGCAAGTVAGNWKNDNRLSPLAAYDRQLTTTLPTRHQQLRTGNRQRITDNWKLTTLRLFCAIKSSAVGAETQHSTDASAGRDFAMQKNAKAAHFIPDFSADTTSWCFVASRLTARWIKLPEGCTSWFVTTAEYLTTICPGSPCSGRTLRRSTKTLQSKLAGPQKV
jgi:hypothetical protein